MEKTAQILFNERRFFTNNRPSRFFATARLYRFPPLDAKGLKNG
jgi:hypothetical protein